MVIEYGVVAFSFCPYTPVKGLFRSWIPCPCVRVSYVLNDPCVPVVPCPLSLELIMGEERGLDHQLNQFFV